MEREVSSRKGADDESNRAIGISSGYGRPTDRENSTQVSTQGDSTCTSHRTSLLPENQAPLIITAAPFGPQWMPSDYPEDIAVSWEAQVQKAVDCYNAGATLLHVHVRDPKTGHVSKNFKEYADFIGRLRQAVPKMVLQVGGSISFAPEPGKEAHWQGYDTRHMLAEIDPKPDQITVVIGSTQMNILPLTTPDDVKGNAARKSRDAEGLSKYGG